MDTWGVVIAKLLAQPLSIGIGRRVFDSERATGQVHYEAGLTAVH